jgi:hypothetical protein
MRFHFACLLFVYLGMLLVACDPASAKDANAANDSNNAPPKSLEFDNQTLNLAWSGGEPGSLIREYIPAGETLEHWTHLASIREYTGPAFSAPDGPAELATETLKTTRELYPNTPAAQLENPTNGDTIIYFCAWPDDQSYLEYNVFKYAKRPAGGIVAWQYALRVYGDATEFTKKLPELSDHLVNEMAEKGLVAESK